MIQYLVTIGSDWHTVVLSRHNAQIDAMLRAQVFSRNIPQEVQVRVKVQDACLPWHCQVSVNYRDGELVE